jgi:class 3 adenylate cyclase/tetratricopeptide (TPR) repeat protein
MSAPLSLASFVPDWVLRRLADDPTPPARPWRESCDAAVLFADLSGFTPLAERLALEGTAGAEKLGELLDRLTDLQVASVAAHGGDVYAFAGDATLAVWAVDEARGAGLSLAVTKAAECALAMHPAVEAQASASALGIPLRLRVGIGAGRLLLGTTGSAGDHCEPYAAGEPIVQVALAERKAAVGEVVLSPAAAAAAGDRLETVPVGQGCHRVTRVRDAGGPAFPRRPVPNESAAAALRLFVPAAVLSRIDAGQGQWLAEFRLVVTLFANVGGIDYEAQDAPGRIASAVAAMRSAVMKYDGAFHQFIVDDKGTTAIAAWGLPGQSHESDAVRALRAARDLLSALGAQGLRGSVGITTGRVFTGTRGSDARRAFTIVGDAVNLAARLMAHAQEGVLVDTATREAASAVFAFETPASLALKGKAKPVVVARPIYREAAGDDRAGASIPRMDGAAGIELVGRVPERQRLEEHLSALFESGRSGMVLLEGEPGIGKSRLVQELVSRATERRIAVLVGAGDAIEQNTAYHSWRAVFTQLLGLGGLPEAERGTAILEQLRDEPRWLSLAPLISLVLPVGLDESEGVRQMTEQARADALRELAVELLRRHATKGPVVLIFEDAHWLDSSSWALALAMRRRVEPLLLVLATRSIQTPPTAEAHALLGDAGASRIRLESLSPEDAVTLVCRRLGVASLPGAVAELIKRKAEGHPFFSEELTYALRDSGVIRIENGHCLLANDAGDLATMQFPDTVEGVIATRIDRFGPKEQLTLKVASVVGRAFPFRVLRAVHPVESDLPELPGHLVRLEAQGLVLAEAPMPDASHLFKHIITQEVTYGRLLHAQRRTLHGKVAHCYEASVAAGSAAPFPLLAHHWERAENSAKAMEYLEKAGEQALAASANREAAGFFARAIKLAEVARSMLAAGPDRDAMDRRRARWERLLGDACLKLAEYARTREHFAKSMALWRHPYPATAPALAAALLGQVARQGLHLMLPVALVRAKDELARESAREVSLMHQRQAEIFYFEQKMPALLHATFANLNFAERAGSPAELTLAYATVAIVSGLSALHPLARMYSARAVRSADRVTDPKDLPVVAYSWLLRGVYIYSTGEWDEAEKYYRKSMALFDRLGDRYRWENANTSIGWQNLFRGRFAEARERFQESLESARRDGTAKMRMWALASDLAATIPEAVPDAQTVAALEAELAHPLDHGDLVFGHGMRLQAHFARGEIDATAEAAAMVERLLRSLPPSTAYCAHGVFGAFEAFEALGAHAHSRGDTALAARWASAARQANLVLRVLAFQNPIVTPRSLIVRARLARTAGNARKARRLCAAAERKARQFGMAYDLRLARAGGGEMLSSVSESAKGTP